METVRLLVLVILTMGLGVLGVEEDVRTEWDRFMRRKYGDPVVAHFVGSDGQRTEKIDDVVVSLSRKERKAKYRNFKNFYAIVEEVNKGNLGYTGGINDMADYSPQFWDNYNGLNLTRRYLQPEDVQEGEIMVGAVGSDGAQTDPPYSVDWVEKQKVTGVKQQGSCGSCWAFAAASCLESHYAIKTGVLKAMSEQQLLDCTYTDGKACDNGGWPSEAWKIVYNRLRNYYPTEDSYGYFGAVRFCRERRGVNGLIASKVDGPPVIKVEYDDVQSFGPPYDNKLAAAVAIGPVAVGIRMINTFRVYKSGTYSESRCQGSPNHAVVVVGYSPQHFRIKNSFGTSWGDDGYAWFDRRIQNQCMIASFAEYPNLLNTEDPDESKPFNACESVTCENGGRCVTSNDGNYATCLCTAAYAGRRCEEPKCEDILKRCPRSPDSRFCKRRKYSLKCPVSCGKC